MLNYILPPIIIIISVSILILFLFRKVRQLPAQEILAEENENQQKKGTLTAIISSSISQFGLKILERLMHKSKLFSLRFHNVSNEWFHSIREKRQQHKLIQDELVENEYQPVETGQETIAHIYPKENVAPIKKPVRPLIRETMVRPQMMNKKNRLEEVLIKRIAINPRDIEAYERLGDYYLESDNYRDSHECFKQVLKLSPAHHKARLMISRIEKIMK